MILSNLRIESMNTEDLYLTFYLDQKIRIEVDIKISNPKLDWKIIIIGYKIIISERTGTEKNQTE